MAKTQIMIKEERVKEYLQNPSDANFFLVVLGILNLNPTKEGKEVYFAFRDFQDAILKRSESNEKHVELLNNAITSLQENSTPRLNHQNLTKTEPTESRFSKKDEKDKNNKNNLTKGTSNQINFSIGY